MPETFRKIFSKAQEGPKDWRKKAVKKALEDKERNPLEPGEFVVHTSNLNEILEVGTIATVKKETAGEVIEIAGVTCIDSRINPETGGETRIIFPVSKLIRADAV